MRFETMVDGRGVELESEKPFLFACCDCGLVHRCAIASHDGKTVGFAVQRDQGETEKRRRDERDRLVRAGPGSSDGWYILLPSDNDHCSYRSFARKVVEGVEYFSCLYPYLTIGAPSNPCRREGCPLLDPDFKEVGE